MGRSAADKARAQRVALIACLLALVVGGPASAARVAVVPGPGDYSVTLEQCVSAGSRSERSATFVAQMVATVATQKMTIKIVLEERTRAEAEYRQIIAPGLGVWRASEPGVKIYKYVKQVTNLTAAASYRTTVKFRWIADKGKVIKHAELRSSRCFQPPLAAPLRPAAAAG